MAITYPLTLPTSGLSDVTFEMLDVTAASTSPFTLQQQVVRHQGQQWSASITVSGPMERDTAEEWIVFLAKLKGQYGTFLLGDPAGTSARGTVSSCVVNGGSQTGETLAVTMTGTLVAGDYIQLGTGATARLHKVLTTQDGSGSLDIWPRLRESPSTGSAVVYASPVGLFRLKTNLRSFSWQAPTLGSVQFTAVEAI